MDNSTKAIIGETTTGGVVGGCCGGALASCEVCGTLVGIVGGAAAGAFILCIACYTGTKFKDLHPVGKGAVVISSTAVGAFGGVSVVESAALGIGAVASTPVLIAGAAVGVVVVGGAVVVGALAAALDEKDDTKEKLNRLEEDHNKMKVQMDLIMTMMQNNKNTAGS